MHTRIYKTYWNNNINTYIIKKELVKNLQKNFHVLLSKWWNLKIMFRLKKWNPVALLMVYYLKMHTIYQKYINRIFRYTSLCLRLINNPFALFLHETIHNSVPRARNHINNSYELIDKLRGQFLEAQLQSCVLKCRFALYQCAITFNH